MKKKTLLLIYTFLICIILARARTAEAQDQNKIFVYPSYLEVSAPGQEFEISINITIAHDFDFFAIQNITWNPNIIELKYGNESDFVEGDYMKAYGTTGFVVTGINQTTGRVNEAMNGYITVSKAPAGSGNLFKILFRGKAVGQTVIAMESAYILDTYDDPEWYLAPENGLVLEDGTVNVLPEFSTTILMLFLLIATASTLLASKLRPKNVKAK
jgi:hypothetical protein